MLAAGDFLRGRGKISTPGDEKITFLPQNHCIFSKSCYNAHNSRPKVDGSDRGAALRIPRRFGRAADGGRGELPKDWCSAREASPGPAQEMRRTVTKVERYRSSALQNQGKCFSRFCHGHRRLLSGAVHGVFVFRPSFPSAARHEKDCLNSGDISSIPLENSESTGMTGVPVASAPKAVCWKYPSA